MVSVWIAWLLLVACWLRVGTCRFGKLNSLCFPLHSSWQSSPPWLMIVVVFWWAYLTCYWPEPDRSSDVTLILYSCNIWLYIRSIMMCIGSLLPWFSSMLHQWLTPFHLICRPGAGVASRPTSWEHPEVWSWTQTQLCQLVSVTLGWYWIVFHGLMMTCACRGIVIAVHLWLQHF